MLEPDDGQAETAGRHRGVRVNALGRAVGRRAVASATPRPLLRLGCGARPGWCAATRRKLTPDRAAYFCHPDWVVSACECAGGRRIWRPEIATELGLKQTAEWYCRGWL